MRSLWLLLALALPVFAQNSAQNRQIGVEAAQPAAKDLVMMPPLGHATGVVDAVPSPDGRWVASISEDGMIRLWERATGRTGRVMRHLLPADTVATAVLFSRDGTRLFSGGDDKKVRVWSVNSGQLLQEWDGPSHRLALDSSGRRLLGAGGAFEIWDAQSGASLKKFPGFFNDLRNEDYALEAAQWAKDGQSVTAVTFMGKVGRWNAETGAILSQTDTKCDPLALSPDGKLLLATAPFYGVPAGGTTGLEKEQTALIDADTGKLLKIVATDKVSGGTFSPDGQWLVLGLENGNLRAQEVATGREILPTGGARRGIVVEAAVAENRPAHRASITSLRFSPDGRTLISGSHDKTARAWSWPDFQQSADFRGYALAPQILLLSPDGAHLALATNSFDQWSNTALDCSLRVLDVVTGRVLRTWNYAHPITALSWDRTGARLWAGSGAENFGNDEKVWEINWCDWQSGARGAPFTGHSDLIYCVTASDDGTRLLSGSNDDTLRLWDTASGHELKKFDAGTSVLDAAFTPGGKVLALENTGGLRIFDLDRGGDGEELELAANEVPNRPATDQFYTSNIGFNPGHILKGGRQILQVVNATTFEAKRTPFLMLRDAASGAALKLWPLPCDGLLTLTPDEKHASILDAATSTIHIWDMAAGRIIRSQKLVEPTVSAAPADNTRLVYTAGTDNAARFTQTQDGKSLLSYVALDGNDWLAYTADGRFDGTPGAIERVYFTQNGQTFSLDQFAERFYQPGLVDLVLRGTGLLAAPNPATLLAQGAPPVVKITTPQTGAAPGEEIEVTVQATAQNNGGVKAIRLYHNGRLVGGPANLRSIVVEAAAPATPQTVQKFSVTLAPGDNLLRAVAYSQTDLESRPDDVLLRWNAPPAAKPTLRVLVIGVNAYRDASMNLAYARPDAEAMGAFFETNKSSFAAVQISRLLDAEATRANIQNALKQLATQSAPNDVALIYLAGHGDTAAPSLALDKDESAPQTFYFLPADAEGMALKEQVRRGGLSGPAIDELVAKIPARKVLMIYDACKSGAAIDTLTRAGAQEQQALALLARAQGIYVLTAANGQQYAGEVRALGHGILTYALLEGLGGKAADVAKTVRVQNLLDYSKERVPALAKEYRGREQWPELYGRGQNFPLVIK